MRTRITAALVAVLAMLTWMAVPALAGSRFRLSAAITDHSGALGNRRAGVQATATSAGSNNTAEFAALAAAGVVLIGVVILATRRRPGRGGGFGHRPPAGPSTPELEAQAARALVDTDDAVKTSDQELGFAVARFGERAAAPFSAALKAARAQRWPGSCSASPAGRSSPPELPGRSPRACSGRRSSRSWWYSLRLSSAC